MLTIEFNAESINTFLNESLSEPITLHNSFLDIEDNLEKLNTLKTEFSYALKDFRMSNNTKFLEVFSNLQSGEYIILNEKGQLVYEGVSFKDQSINLPTVSIEDYNLLELVEERKNLQERLVVVNGHIVNRLTESLDIFDDVINKLEELKGTWSERIDEMLGIGEDIEEDSITAFTEMINSLKAMQDKLSSEAF